MINLKDFGYDAEHDVWIELNGENAEQNRVNSMDDSRDSTLESPPSPILESPRDKDAMFSTKVIVAPSDPQTAFSMHVVLDQRTFTILLLILLLILMLVVSVVLL